MKKLRKGKIVSSAFAAVFVIAVALMAAGCAGPSGSEGGIGMDQALAAALADAGLQESDVDIVRSKTDQDDGRIVYEFDFIKDNYKYEYDIDGSSGSVLEFSKESIRVPEANPADDADAKKDDGSGDAAADKGRNDGSSGQAAANSGSVADADYIGADKAKSIALEDAGVSASDASFTKAKLDRDDGRYQYDIEFYAGDYEYEYEIDAISGKVLDRDSDSIYD